MLQGRSHWKSYIYVKKHCFSSVVTSKCNPNNRNLWLLCTPFVPPRESLVIGRPCFTRCYLFISWLWKRDTRHWGFNESLIGICRQGGMGLWHFLPLGCIWVQPLQRGGGVQSCGASSSRLDEGWLIVLCADMAIRVYSVSLYSAC